MAGAENQGLGVWAAQLGTPHRSDPILYLLSRKDQSVLPKHSSELVDIEHLKTVSATQTTTGCSHTAQATHPPHRDREAVHAGHTGQQPDARLVTFSFLYQLLSLKPAS